VPRLGWGSKPGYYETSDYLIGEVAVDVILLESDGTIDPSMEDWTADEINRVIAEIVTALSWWEAQNPSAGVTFRDEAYIVSTSYEPISRPSTDQNLWISEAITHLGYPGTNYFTQVRDYVNDLRKELHTDWAFVIFVVDSSKDSDGYFTDDYFAYAYLGGPFLVMTYDNDGWGIDNMDRVTAHEIGHIFYATDEYDGETEYSGYLNVSDVEGSGALMDESEWWLSEGTKGQIGWRDTDGDGILDIVDTFPKTTLTSAPPDLTDATVITYRGLVEEIPYPNRNPWGTGRDVTINTIKTVRFRVDGGTWLSADSTDGSFDDVGEEFTFTTPNLPVGMHTVEVYSVNSVNNFETPSLRHTFTVTFIIIDRSSVSVTRVDVGSIQEVKFRAIWAHDLSPVRDGTIFVNGVAHTTGPDGWVKVSVSSSQVGKQSWSITGVEVGDITRYAQTAPSPEVIFDRVAVTLSVPDTRIDVGASASISKSAIYEYDGAVFTGTINLNDTETKSVVGKYGYRALSISDPTYGLTVFTTNVVHCIFDRVQVTITTPQERVEVETGASLNWTGKYEYDGATFSGEVTLSEELMKSSIGRFSYTVKGVHDPLYGLKTFVSNTVYVIFDSIVTGLQTETLTPGSVKFTVRLRYQFDSAPVVDAKVVINGIEATNLGDGSYITRVSTWSPYVTHNIQIDRSGFNTIQVSGSVFALGNITIIASTIAVLAVVIVVAIKRRKFSRA